MLPKIRSCGWSRTIQRLCLEQERRKREDFNIEKEKLIEQENSRAKKTIILFEHKISANIIP